MKNFLLSLKFIIKRVFRLTAYNIVWLIVTALIVAIGTAAMGVEPVARGDYDYQSYLMMLPYWLVFLSFGLSSMYSDVYASVYIRTSGLYKCLRTRAVQVFILLFDVVTLIPAVIVTAVVNPAALPDFLLVSASVCRFHRLISSCGCSSADTRYSTYCRAFSGTDIWQTALRLCRLSLPTVCLLRRCLQWRYCLRGL